MKYYTIYKITNKINKKIYIGCHQTNNLDDKYMGSSKALSNSIKKYGIENFEKEIIHLCKSKEEMFAKELEIVNENFVRRRDTYNLMKGGLGDRSLMTKKAIEKLIILRKNPEWIKKQGKAISAGLKKFNQLEENKKSRKEKWFVALKGKGPTAGHKLKDEHKRKISIANSICQKGDKNSQYGSQWIYNEELKESKKILKGQNIPEGWRKGRRLKF